MSAFISVYGTASSAHAEYAIDARAVAGLPVKQFHALVILRRNSRRTAFGFALRNDFGALPPTYIFDLLIGPRYKGPPSFDVETVVLIRDDSSSLVFEKNATTIDLSSIYGLSQVTDFSQFATVSAQPRGVTGPINAVDGRADTFWEVCEQPFPIELEVNYPAARTLLGYELATVEAPERMPSKWEIWITSDGQGWHRLQEVADAKPWNVREVRQFDVTPMPEVIGIKLVISASRRNGCMRLYEFRPIFEMPADQDQNLLVVGVESAPGITAIRLMSTTTYVTPCRRPYVFCRAHEALNDVFWSPMRWPLVVRWPAPIQFSPTAF